MSATIRVCAGQPGAPTVYFFHGAYQTVWQWRRVVDDLLLGGHVECFLIPLPGSPGSPRDVPLDVRTLDLAAEIEREAGSREIVLAGHSLGAAFACQLAPRFSKDARLKLFLSSLPVGLSAVAVEARGRLAAACAALGRLVSPRALPLALRGQVLTDPSHAALLRSLSAPDELVKALRSAPVRTSIHVACGMLDPISGPLRSQRAFVSRLRAEGMQASFRSLGLTSHFPVFWPRGRYTGWLLDGLAEGRPPPERGFSQRVDARERNGPA